MHARQHYELAHWSRANTELNYRRFFAVTTLAGVRQEDPSVFDATHELIGALPEDGVDGLRVDHPDGLVDPGGYLERLGASPRTPGSPSRRSSSPVRRCRPGRWTGPPATTPWAR